MDKRTKVFVLVIFFLAVAILGNAQSCSTTISAASVNWSAASWTCGGGGTAPTTNNGSYTEALTVNNLGNGETLVIDISFTLTGNLTVNNSGSNPTVTIPAGVTVVIIGDFTVSSNNLNLVVNGTLVVTGTLSAGNGTQLSGSGSISGGSLNLGGGTTGCSGSCPGLSFTGCSSGGGICATNTTSSTYIWNGSTSSDWQTSSNWTPTRTTPATTDVLNFTGTGSNRNITNVPTQSVGKILVTGSTTYSFVTASSSKTLTLTSLEGAALQIDNGSTLSLGNASFAINITLPSTGLAQIGGQLNLVNGNLGAGNATLELHTNSTPLARTSGQVSMDASSNLRFGSSLFTTGASITLPDNIFVSSPTINSLTINRTNGASLGNQSITVSSSATFTLGDLTTNAAGRIRFASTASNPTESSGSKIIGYAEMLSRSVTTGALNFLGFTMAAGANNVGNMTLVRRTGASGINTFNGNQSIAATWDITSGSDPAAGRNISFSWQSAFDNVTAPANQFQIYYFNSGPGWTTLGALQTLAAQGPPRQTATVSTTKLNDTFTVTDNTQILPVELISFNAQKGNGIVEIKWTTASEFNNDYFDLERSADGEKFSKLGTVTGKGTIYTKSEYRFIDQFPLSGVSYYRLKQVDVDGEFSYSKVVAVTVDDRELVRLDAYPNPFNGKEITIVISGVEDETVPLMLYDLMGRECGKFLLDSNTGKLSLSLDQSLAPGTYVLLAGTSRALSKRLVVY